MNAIRTTDRWEIFPDESLGILRFGLTRSDVRSLLGTNVRTFRKGPFAKRETDAYDQHCLHLFYDATDRLECMNAFGSCPLCYKDVLLLQRNVPDVLKDLASLGFTSRYDDGYFFDELGFCIFAPGETVEAVTIYRQGYYTT